MQLALNERLIELPKKYTSPKRVVLSERDLELLEYILDMKFVSVEDVYRRFFKITGRGEEAKNNSWAKKRMWRLEQARYVKSTRSFSEATRFYIATIKAYHALRNNKPGAVLSKPSQGIDQRIFLHDKLVLQARSHLENTKQATIWISDRKLRSNSELAGGLTNLYIPDGIYTNASGAKVAFELEIAIKAKSRYHDKIKKYVQLLRSTQNSSKVFEMVHFVCAKDAVIKHLVKETKIYGDLFKIESLDSFFSQTSSIPSAN